MKKKTDILFLTLLSVFIFVQPAFSIEKFTILTETLPPFSYQEDNSIKGIATDTVLAVLNNAGYPTIASDILVYPWVRAYKDVQKKPNTILFSMARTEDRENKFKWVGPITKLTIGVFGKKGIEIGKISDFDEYEIGTVRDGAPEQLLIKAGVSPDNLQRASHPLHNIKKLDTGRIDLFVFNIPTTIYLMKKEDIDASRFEIIYLLKEVELYMAFHGATDDSIIKKIQIELEKFKESGEYDALLAKYL